jgi:hypothetical protein
MNSKLFTLLVLAGLLVGLAVAPASAQTITQLRANIPFEFMVGGTTLPAGEYIVNARLTPGGLTIRSEDGREGALALVNPTDSPYNSNQTTLVFNRYGNQYFLSQIWMPYRGMGYQVPKSKVEREASRTASVQRQELVILAQR